MSEPGSFAHLTLTQRWPAIAQRVIAENDFPAEISDNLSALVQELFDGVIRSLKDDSGPDLAAWTGYLEPFIGQPWLNVPWYFAEVYFYRRLLEATQYFRPESQQGSDPFASQKRHSLKTAMDDIRVMSTQINAWIEQAHDRKWNQTDLASLLYSNLWGNQADLSLRPTTTSALMLSQSEAHILVDDALALVDRLANLQQARIDVITDNVGAELTYDLYLADVLLTSKIAGTVHLHLKAHPTFVSDATIQDVHDTLATLAIDPSQDIQSQVERLKGYVDAGQLQLCQNLFWTAPLAFWDMPQPLRQELAQASLVLIKGDANYRRLLGDCHWPYTTVFSDIVRYFPAPFVALRTLKSEVVAGLQPNQVETLNHEDPQWLTNGQWGVIQFANPGHI